MGDGTISSTADELKGQAKEAVGDVTDNGELQAEGAADKGRAEAERGDYGNESESTVDSPTAEMGADSDD